MECDRLGCTYAGTYRFRYLPAHFTDGEDPTEERICSVCKDEHRETMVRCGHLLLGVEKVPTKMAA